MEISQAGSCNRKNTLLRVTNVIAHGPGIKLLNGLFKTSTNGVHDLRLPLPSHTLLLPASDGTGPMLKFLTVIGPARWVTVLLSRRGEFSKHINVSTLTNM